MKNRREKVFQPSISLSEIPRLKQHVWRYGRRVKCVIQYYALGAHLEQIFAGFELLRRRGLVKVIQARVEKPTWPAAPPILSRYRSHLRVLVEDSLWIHFDVDDSAIIPMLALNASDFYFKRSHSLQSTEGDKILPLGLNVPVRVDGLDWLSLERTLRLFNSFSGSKNHHRRSPNSGDYVPTVAELEMNSQSMSTNSGKILFLTRAWDPAEAKSEEAATEREHLNEMRANCIRALRAHFGTQFFGGIEPTPYAIRYFPDCLIDSGRVTKLEFFENVRNSRICVTTTGLHGSIGWKFAEYVAASKPIVAERTVIQLPGTFGEGSHYLGFESVQGCIDAIVRLQGDQALRDSMSAANRDYYSQWVRPDALVAYVLTTALQTLSTELT